MKLIKPYFEIIEPTGYTIDDIYKSIELAGKVSHKSEHTIKEGSAKNFVERIINWGHNSCLEFGTVYLYINYHHPNFSKIVDKYYNNPYSECIVSVNEVFITSNYRVLIENEWLNDLKYLCEPTKFHMKRYTIKFICSRSISHEFVRHRKFSFMQESQRYVAYNKDRFNYRVTFIQPNWFTHDLSDKVFSEIPFSLLQNTPEDGYKEVEEVFIKSAIEAEQNYFELLENGLKPEEAREVLPNATKTELYMCGFTKDWEQFFRLRDDKQHAHPMAYELAHPLHEEFIKRGWCE